jgi:biopolymer transport protein ExbB
MARKPAKLNRTRARLAGVAIGLGAGVLSSLPAWAEDAGGAAAVDPAGTEAFGEVWTSTISLAERLALPTLEWLRSISALERVAWAGLLACAALALITVLGRALAVRRGHVIPPGYRERFHARLVESRLDWGQGIDYCELNPSPASRVALAAIKQWGRPPSELERGIRRARKLEVDRLRSQVGTLRRVAALAPLVGLLGTLSAAGRIFATLPQGLPWGPLVPTALLPLTVSVGLAILALVAYDGLTGRIESLACELDRLGAETVEAIALSAPPPARLTTAHRGEPPASSRSPHTQVHTGAAAPPPPGGWRLAAGADV